MARKIEIPLSINPRDLIRGLKLSEREFEDFERSIRDVEDAGDDLERDLEANFKSIRRAADRAGDDVADELGGGLRGGKFGELGSEIGDEFVQSWGEAVRAGNPAEAIGETVTNAGQIASIFGPAGAAVGLGVALVGGMVQGIRDKGADLSAELLERVQAVGSSLFDWARENGYNTGAQFASAIQQGLQDQAAREVTITEALGVEDYKQALVEINEIYRDTGIEVDVISGAIEGNRDAQAAVLEQLFQNQAEIDRINEALNTGKDTGYESAAAAAEMRDRLNEQNGIINNDLIPAMDVTRQAVSDTNVALSTQNEIMRLGAVRAANVALQAGATAANWQAALDAARAFGDVVGGIPARKEVALSITTPDSSFTAEQYSAFIYGNTVL